MHGYRLKLLLELFMGNCLSVNYGAIYPLLKRLEERGYVEVIAEEAGDAGSCRKIYTITPSGRDRWRYKRYKMLEQPQESWVKSRSRFLIKFFFFSDLEPQARVKLLEARLVACYQRQAHLNQEGVGTVLPTPTGRQFGSGPRRCWSRKLNGCVNFCQAARRKFLISCCGKMSKFLKYY